MEHTCMSTESPEGQVLLQDKLITQLTPGIRRKLQKLAFGPEQNLKNLLKVTTSVFYNKDEEEKRDWDRRDKPKTRQFMMALQRVSLGLRGWRKGDQPKGPGPGLVSSAAEMGILVGNALSLHAPNCQSPTHSVNETTGSWTVLRGGGNWSELEGPGAAHAGSCHPHNSVGVPGDSLCRRPHHSFLAQYRSRLFGPP